MSTWMPPLDLPSAPVSCCTHPRQVLVIRVTSIGYVRPSSCCPLSEALSQFADGVSGAWLLRSWLQTWGAIPSGSEMVRAGFYLRRAMPSLYATYCVNVAGMGY